MSTIFGMGKTTRKFFALLLPALAAGSMSYAQSRLDSLLLLQEVGVSARRQAEIIAPQKLGGAQIERLNSHSVADAIRFFSGAQLKDYGGIGGLKTVNIRSMGTNHAGVFYDGLQLGNAQNGQIDLGKFSLDNMEEIALYNGQKSEIFQPARDFGPSGAVYLQSRRPQFEGEKKYRVQATVKCGSFGLANPSVLWEQKITERVSSQFNAEYTYATGRYKFRYRRTMPDGSTAYDTTAVRENGDIRALRVEGGFFGATERGKWNAKVYYYDSERGIPGPILNNVWRHGERQWDRDFFVQGSFRNDFGKRYHLLVNTKYAYDYTEYLRDDYREMYVHNHYRQQEYYVSAAQMVNIFPWWDISLSTDFQWNCLDADLRNFARPVRYTEMAALATALQWWRIQIQGSLLGTFTQERAGGKPKVSRGTPERAFFTPALFVSCKPLKNHDLQLRAFCKKALRMPTFNDLYYTDIGNKYLKPERTTQYDGGILYRRNVARPIFRGVEVQGDGYYNVVTDKIVAYPTGRQFRWTMLNLGRVVIRGCDMAAQVDLMLGKVGVNARACYTFQKAQDRTDRNDRFYGDQIPYIPLHSGSVLLAADWKAWGLNYSFIYTGERYNSSENTRLTHMQPWYTSDLSISRSFAIKRVRFRATGEVNNLFNQYYDVVANYPMPGINFKVILKIEI